MTEPTKTNPPTAAPKPGPLSPANLAGGHTDTNGANALPVDSVGRSLEVGDGVTLVAVVTGVSPDGKVNLEVSHPRIEGKWSMSGVAAGVVTHSGLNPRIGAAPQLRTPVVEVPAKAGGVKPVARDEYNRDNDTESTAGLPSATATAASRLAAA